MNEYRCCNQVNHTFNKKYLKCTTPYSHHYRDSLHVKTKLFIKMDNIYLLTLQICRNEMYLIFFLSFVLPINSNTKVIQCKYRHNFFDTVPHSIFISITIGIVTLPILLEL